VANGFQNIEISPLYPKSFLNWMFEPSETQTDHLPTSMDMGNGSDSPLYNITGVFRKSACEIAGTCGFQQV
jgi:hypothetical protein